MTSTWWPLDKRFERIQRLSRLLDHSGGHPDASVATRHLRTIAQEKSALEHGVDDGGGSRADTHQHEVGLARPEHDMVPATEIIDELFGLTRLRDRPVH